MKIPKGSIEAIKKLREQGHTYYYIASKFKVSRQRVHQMLEAHKGNILYIQKPKDKVMCQVCGKKDATRKVCKSCVSLLGKFQGIDRTREFARIRDKHTCQTCGKKQGKRSFDVHHLKGLCGKLTKTYDRVENLPILITLCHKCHFNHPEHSRKLRNRG